MNTSMPIRDLDVEMKCVASKDTGVDDSRLSSRDMLLLKEK